MSRSARVLSALLLVLAACGYHLAGRGSFLPEEIRVIGIPPFDSTVPRREVAEDLTEAVTHEFISRGGYRIVTSATGADAVLQGTITGLVVTPIAFDEDGRATRSLLSITAQVSLRHVKQEKVLYESPGFQFRTELELAQDSVDFFDPESEAIDQVARDFARSLVATIVEGF